MVRTVFNDSLNEMHNDVVNMANVAKQQICESIQSLVNKDITLAEKVIKNDDIVDNMEKEIEDKAIKLIATQQPLAYDLRDIFTATKIITDLERIADLAVDIAKITKKLYKEQYMKQLIDIPRMSNIVESMISDSLQAYIDKDAVKAYEICKRDDEIDSLYKQIFSELLIMMMENTKLIAQASQFLFISKYLERAGDHVTNICEWIIYLSTGELVDLNE
ncbi:hypothetical protein CLTEP_03300 [Clostridium tepidiprofundi DSM 19306]|uniref:Phosphate-specific transport system accessory protein PhoU n=1 Tax=Clostridium tepidiprofundi DSM 19306 TaxID=1121338 RepID=A0A151B7Q3_9CLOT|nr:phosphate signaling complex protein PhoU [Clostridium tepidiprofundi]KYH35936.1 hypothetical protein CLTEP_03300 [Clostridium tepidiprofundi DSM 19306]